MTWRGSRAAAKKRIFDFFLNLTINRKYLLIIKIADEGKDLMKVRIFKDTMRILVPS